MEPVFILSLALYAVTVATLGWLARRKAARSPEEYFLAGRALGPLVLFMALFGTNVTSFVLVGVPAKAFMDGLGTFSLNVPIVALGLPLSFWAIGVPARKAAIKWNALTPSELYSKQLGSPAAGKWLFLFFSIYTLPYMVQAVKGAAVTLESVSDGAVSQTMGAGMVVALALSYTWLGGMRATAWTNVLQGSLFLAFMIAVLFLIPQEFGGWVSAFDQIAERRPDLLTLPQDGLFSKAAWTSWSLVIAITVVCFPHILARLMAAKSERALRAACLLYPPATVLVWLPAVLLGVFAAVFLPEAPSPDQVFAATTSAWLPSWLASLGFLAVLAAVMSTLDAQVLVLSSMLTRDVSGKSQAGKEVQQGRIFALLTAALVWFLAVQWGSSVFDIAALAFSGYTVLAPTLFFGLRWNRFGGRSAIASMLAGNAVLFLCHFNIVNGGSWLPAWWGFWAAILAGFLFQQPPSSKSNRDPLNTATA
ncbi:MAG: sodium:solute symporter family protein [Planctomycetota bacterium]|nr:MAG: sodium:solute symporter family protein [Planctomycetota bacterium]